MTKKKKKKLFCSNTQDAVYIDLGGSHAHKGEGTVPNDLVSSLMETRHPLDAKMKQSQVSLFKVYRNLKNIYKNSNNQ